MDGGESNKKAMVKSTLSTSLNAPPSNTASITATSQLLPSLSEGYPLTSDGDNPAYSPFVTGAGATAGCHRNRPAWEEHARRHITGDASALISSGKHHFTPSRTDIFLWIKGNASLKKCFRCLVSDLLVSTCCDPIKYAKCLRSRHKSHQCKKPFANSMSDSSDSSAPTRRSPTTTDMIIATANLLLSHTPSPCRHSTSPTPPTSNPPRSSSFSWGRVFQLGSS